MTRRRRVVFALIAVITFFAAPAAVLLAVDVHLHTKYQRAAGFNVWGYRGPVIGRKKAGEYRVAVLGGSSAYGYGVTWDEAMPHQLERFLMAQPTRPAKSFRVANLGYNNEGVYSFTFTQRDYDYLQSDLVCLYEGYNDLSGDPQGENHSVFRRDSPVFRLTGYLPIFPIVFKEKAAMMLAGGDPNALYYLTPHKTTFRPDLATQAAADALRTAGEIGQSLERQLGRVAVEPPRHVGAVDGTGCKYPWGQYCRSIGDAITLALERHRQALFITQPYETGNYLRMRHMEQQREAAAMVARRFGGNPNVGYVNLGLTVDLDDIRLSFDHMHLTAEGNRRVAAALIAPVTQMAARATRRN